MDEKKSGKGIKKNEMLFASITWFVLIVIIGWIFGAVGWWLLVTLWKKELLIPENVIATTYMTFTILGLAIVFFLLFQWWRRYNYNKYFKKNKRIKFTLNEHAPYLTKNEALLIIQEDKNDKHIPNFEKVWKDHIYNKDYKNSDPLKLLSRAKIYNEKKAFKEAASLLRIVISHPQAQSTVKKAALKELEIALHNLGPLAKEVSAGYKRVKGG